MEHHPQSVHGEIFDARRTIEGRLVESYVLDEFAAERLKRRIQAALNVSGLPNIQRSALHHELASLFGMQRKYQEAIQQLTLAKGLGMDPFAIAFTLSHVALLNGHMLDSRSTVENVWVEATDKMRDLLASHQAQAGMIGGFMAEGSVKTNAFKESIEAARILHRIGVDDIELTKRLDTACRVIQSKIQHPILAYTLFAKDGEGILYRYVVKAPIDALIELNEMILDALLEKHDGPLDQELSICVAPWVPEDKPLLEEAYHVSLPQ